MEAGTKGKGGGDHRDGQAKLGSIMVVLGKTIQSVDDLEILNNFQKRMVSALRDAIFAGQLKSMIGQPTQLKPMIDICDLKDQMQRS